MSVYERDKRTRTCLRHNPETGDMEPCAYDEPETRQRKPTEGMMVFPPGVLLSCWVDHVHVGNGPMISDSFLDEPPDQPIIVNG